MNIRQSSNLDGMRGEISVIKGVHADIVESFNDYILLKETDGQGRHKRKVFGWLGDLMSDVFDIATNAEISSIQRNVYKLAANQDTLMHVVEESLSILNVSRMEIKENRQRINDLLMLIGSVEDKVINMSNHLEQEIREARTIVVLFSRLNTLKGELKLALSRSMYFYVHFQIQIQAVAMQKLSPTTIPAERLRIMLLEIKEKLPQTVGLPRDPRAHLFDYYKLLSCIPIFDGKHIIISIRVPLVEYSQQFDIFRAYSLPVPLLGRTRVDKDDKKLLAYYKLESNYLAINSDRSQYILLTETQVKDCVQSGLQICNVKSPKCRREIAASLNDFSNRWCKRENVEPDALKEWKINIFKIIDTRISFYSHNTHLLPPKPKSSFSHLKRGIQDFHMNYVLVPADKAANNVVVV